MIISKLLRLKIYGFLLWFYQQHDDIPKKLSILKYIQKPTLKVNYFLRRICNYFANKIIYKKYFEFQRVFLFLIINNIYINDILLKILMTQGLLPRL